MSHKWKQLLIFYAQLNNILTVWLFFIAGLLVKPIHKELKFPIGKVG